MPPSIQFRRTGFRAWITLVLVLTVVGAILIAVAVVAIGILLFLLPVLAVAGLLSYLFLWLKFRGGGRKGSNEPVILDGEFRILDTGEIEHQPRNSDTKTD